MAKAPNDSISSDRQPLHVMGLTAKLLIAMPGMADARFEKSVVFLCAHSAEGAMGLIINKPARDLSFAQLLDQIGIEAPQGAGHWTEPSDVPVHFGGPVEHGRGFVLHSADYFREGATLAVDARFAMTATVDVLQAIAGGKGPESSLLALGYAGWGPGQLEREIGQNGWLTCEASHDLVFTAPNPAKWGGALKSLGVDALSLSAVAGRA